MTSLQITQFKLLIKPSPSIYAALYWNISIKSLEHLTTGFVLNNYSIHVLGIGGAKKTLCDLTLLYFRMTLLEQKASKGCWMQCVKGVTETPQLKSWLYNKMQEESSEREMQMFDILRTIWSSQWKTLKETLKSSWKSIENQWTTICWELLLGLFFPCRICYPETSP